MINKLIEKIQKTHAPIVVGLDPMLNYVPEHIQKRAFAEYGETLEGAAEAIWQYNKGIVDAVVDHQYLIHCRIHDETGTGEVAFRVAAVEQLCAVLFRRKEYLVPVAAFLFGFGCIGSKTFFPVSHILFLHDVSHVVCPFFLTTPHKP